MNALFSFIFFAFTVMVAPGPNNLMIMHSGLNFGTKRSMPHFAGIIIGEGLMLFIIALGFGYIFEKIPEAQIVIKVLGTLYILFLAWKVSRMHEEKCDGGGKRPLTFMQAALFQWVNPKAWMICISFSGMFHFIDQFVLNAIFLIIIIALVSVVCVSTWITLGRLIEKIVNSDRQRNIFNSFLALLLLLSVVLLWV